MAGQVTRVSTNAAGGQTTAGQIVGGTGGYSGSVRFSPDGTKVVFISEAGNLVPDDTQFLDVFVKDLVTGAVQRVSTTPTGSQADGSSDQPVFSPDGGSVMFRSSATTLDPTDASSIGDVFIKNLDTGAVARVSTTSDGGQASSSSFDAVFSADGLKVAFTSLATNLVPDDTNGYEDVFLKNLQTGQVQRLSQGSGGEQATGGDSFRPVFSSDGSKVVFLSAASDLVTGDTNGGADVFIKTIASGEIERVSLSASGAQLTNSYFLAAYFAPDSRIVAIEGTSSGGGGLAVSNSNDQIWVENTAFGGVTAISSSATGQLGNADSRAGTFSPDGTKLAFWSRASNLVPGDTNGIPDIFIKDLRTGGITRVSVDETGAQGLGRAVPQKGFVAPFPAEAPSFSPDGTKIAFQSYAANLVPGDTNGFSDVFVKVIGGDTIGDAGQNTLLGGAGDDHLVGLGGNDVLRPGAGVNALDGGDGIDVADYSGELLAIYADLRTSAGFVNGVQVDTFMSIEALGGGLGNDLLVGDEGRNALAGQGGRDQLFGFGGDDLFAGGQSSLGSQNQLWGGEGNDTVDYHLATAPVFVDLRAPAGYVGGVLKDLMNSVEGAVGGSGVDTLVGADADNNVLSGGAGADVLFGLGGNDVLIGGSASAGTANQLWGGEGLDTAAYTGTTASVYADLAAMAGYVSDGTQLVLADTYNSIERLMGGSGGDTLAGDGGDNKIAGSGGADILYGRGGSDTFVFASASESNLSTGYDTVADFDTGLDKVDLSAMGLDASSVLILTDEANGTSALYADTDASADGYELAIAFAGAHELTIDDIVF